MMAVAASRLRANAGAERRPARASGRRHDRRGARRSRWISDFLPAASSTARTMRPTAVPNPSRSTRTSTSPCSTTVAAKTVSPDPPLHRQRLARHRLLIDQRLAADHRPVHRHAGARRKRDDVAPGKLLDADRPAPSAFDAAPRVWPGIGHEAVEGPAGGHHRLRDDRARPRDRRPSSRADGHEVARAASRSERRGLEDVAVHAPFSERRPRAQRARGASDATTSPASTAPGTGSHAVASTVPDPISRSSGGAGTGDGGAREGAGRRRAARTAVETIAQLAELRDEPLLGEREGVVVDDDAARDRAAQDGPHPGEPAQPRLHGVRRRAEPGNGIPDPQAAASRVGDVVAHAQISSPGCCSRGRARARTRAPTTTRAAPRGRLDIRSFQRSALSVLVASRDLAPETIGPLRWAWTPSSRRLSIGRRSIARPLVVASATSRSCRGGCASVRRSTRRGKRRCSRPGCHERCAAHHRRTSTCGAERGHSRTSARRRRARQVRRRSPRPPLERCRHGVGVDVLPARAASATMSSSVSICWATMRRASSSTPMPAAVASMVSGRIDAILLARATWREAENEGEGREAHGRT